MCDHMWFGDSPTTVSAGHDELVKQCRAPTRRAHLPPPSDPSRPLSRVSTATIGFPSPGLGGVVVGGVVVGGVVVGGVVGVVGGVVGVVVSVVVGVVVVVPGP